MFSLRNSLSGSSSGSDEDSFGWWIGIEAQGQTTNSPSYSSGTSDDISRDRTLARNLAYEIQQQQQQQQHSPLSSTDPEDIEMRLLDANVKPEDTHRRALCYTPERLIRSEDYRIVAPSPRSCPALSIPGILSHGSEPGDSGWTAKTMDDRIIGPEHLTGLLRSSYRSLSSSSTSCKRCCCIWYCDGEVLLHTECCPRSDEEVDGLSDRVDLHLRSPSGYDSCCDDNKRFNGDFSSKEEDRKSEPADDEIRILPTVEISKSNLESHSIDVREELKEYDDKQQRRRHSQKWTTAPSQTISTVCEEKIKTNLNTDEVLSVVSANLDESPRSTKALTSTPKCLTKMVWNVQPGKKLIPLKRTDPELELELLRGKLEKIQGSNKNLYQEITLLRRDFMKDEWRVNHLSEDVNKLRNEVYELRYMDDLLKLLKGELERISNRNWPFAIGHTQHGTEEINLVV